MGTERGLIDRGWKNVLKRYLDDQASLVGFVILLYLTVSCSPSPTLLQSQLANAKGTSGIATRPRQTGQLLYDRVHTNIRHHNIHLCIYDT